MAVTSTLLFGDPSGGETVMASRTQLSLWFSAISVRSAFKENMGLPETPASRGRLGHCPAQTCGLTQRPQRSQRTTKKLLFSPNSVNHRKICVLWEKRRYPYRHTPAFPGCVLGGTSRQPKFSQSAGFSTTAPVIRPEFRVIFAVRLRWPVVPFRLVQLPGFCPKARRVVLRRRILPSLQSLEEISTNPQ